jgi:phenylpyruvate tautomerase PptA (4-oxalocrotonate tautomerase family)
VQIDSKGGFNTMPMIDAFVPPNALTLQAEQELFREVTDIVVKHEIGDSQNERARNAAWIFVHRPVMYVAGLLAAEPRYRFIVSVPEGQFDEERRQAITAEITEAVAKAENRSWEEVRSRVWVVTAEVPDGTWGARGQVVRLPDILSSFLGEQGRAAALERIGRRAGW